MKGALLAFLLLFGAGNLWAAFQDDTEPWMEPREVARRAEAKRAGAEAFRQGEIDRCLDKFRYSTFRYPERELAQCGAEADFFVAWANSGSGSRPRPQAYGISETLWTAETYNSWITSQVSRARLQPAP